MSPPKSPYRVPQEHTPGPGHNESHSLSFASDITHKMQFGGKYKPIVSDTPSSLKYNPNESVLSTRPRSPEATIRLPTMLVYE